MKGMNGKFFLDTNLFVYCFDRTAPAKARRAGELIHQAVTKRCGVVSYQVVQEFLNVALRRFTVPLAIPEAEQYLTVVLRPLLAVHSSSNLFSEALRLCDRHSLGWYDSLIVAAALECHCSILYSEDLQHGLRIGELRVENPFL
jgi:predicted nucleic acid-binding protein